MNRPLLQTLGEKTQPIAIEPEALNNVTSSAAKNEDVTREGLFVEHRLHLRTQSIEASTHVCHAGSQPYLRACAKLNHLRRLSRIERNSAGSAPLSTVIIARPGNSM